MYSITNNLIFGGKVDSGDSITMLYINLLNNFTRKNTLILLHFNFKILLIYFKLEDNYSVVGVWVNPRACYAFLVAQMVKNLPAMQETHVPSLGWEDPLEKGMATHSSILAWRIPWTEEPGGLHPWGSQRDSAE